LRWFRKTVGIGAEVTSGSRLFQRWLSATGNARSPAVDSGSLDARMTTTGGGGWNRRRARCSRKDTLTPDHAGDGNTSVV